MAETQVKTALILTAYDKMSRVVNETMNKSITSLNRFKKTADRLGTMGGKVGPIGGMITAAGVYEFGKNAVEMAEKYEDATIQMRQSLTNAAGMVDPMFGKLMKMGDQLAGTFKGGKTEMYGMINALINTGMQAKDITGNFANSINQYATLMKIPYNEAATMIGRVVKMGKIAQKDMSALPDLLSRMKVLGVSNAEDIAMAVGRSGMGVMGIGGLKNMQSMAAIIVKIQQATGGAARAGQGMQMIMSKMADPAKMKKFSAELRKSGIAMQFYDKGGKFLGIQNMVAQLGQVPANLRQQLFGKMFGARGGIIAASMADMGVKGYNDTVSKMMNQESLAKKALERTQLASYKLARTWDQFKDTVIIPIGLKLLPILGGLATKATNLIKTFASWYHAHSVLGGIIKWTVIILAGFRLAIMVSSFLVGGLFRNLGQLAGGFIGALKFIKSATFAMQYYRLVLIQSAIWQKVAAIAQWIFNASLWGCPIVWIVAGIAAVIAAVVLMVKYWKPITAFFSKIWGSIKIVFSKSWEWIKGVFIGFWNWLKGWGKWILLPLAPFILMPVIIIQNWSKITAFFSKLWAGIKGVFNGVINWIKGIGTMFYNAGANIVTSIWNGIKSMAAKPIEAIKNIVKKIRNFLPFSPAKEGPLADLHKVRIIETIVQTMKATPMTRAMQQITGKVAGAGFKFAGGGGSGGQLIYSPIVNLYGSATAKDKEDFMMMLKSHESDVMRWLDSVNRSNERKRF